MRMKTRSRGACARPRARGEPGARTEIPTGDTVVARRKLTYKDAGVNIDVSNDLEDGYLQLMQSTFTPQVIQNPGGFGGLYRLKGTPGLFSRQFRDPVLVSGTDGVGTKLKIAFLLDRHDTVGIDLVAMSVNDILVQGAEPIFFLDYVASGKVEARVMLDIVRGVADGCRQAGCALLGGETAELPGFYAPGEYDLAGFAVGVVERQHLLDGRAVRPGDVILGLASSGLHSNGYSLARKALLEEGGLDLHRTDERLGCTLGEALLEPTRIYVRPVLAAMRAYRKKKPVHALAHITGGGLVENVPRVLPKDCDALFRWGSWPLPPIFPLVQECGNVDDEEMRRVFNMGLGMVMVVSEVSANVILQRLKRAGCPGFRVGQVVPGSGVVRFEG